MIEAAIQSLKGTDRASKLETYTVLSNLFRAFDNVPDRSELVRRTGELFELVLNDVSRGIEENHESPDVPLNTKALKVAGFMLFDQQIAAAVPAKLARVLLEQTLTRMEAERVTKSTSTQVLWLWQTQHLPRSTLAQELAERMLLAAMKVDLPSLIINQERMALLLRLLEQSRESMIKHADVWLPRVINCMLDANPAIRTAALRTALEAGKHLCKVPSVGRCLQNHLRSEVAGVPFIEITKDRFRGIIQEPEGGVFVAHAWGSICTLSSSQNPEKSKTLMDWMHVLQIVFNSPTTENKIMAQSAWVRMIHYFTNNGDIVYREKNLSYLTKPMSRMLSRELKVYDTVRMAAVNSVCSLLYALMKPSLSHNQATLVWDQVVAPVLTVMLEDFQKEAIQERAISILISLLEQKNVEPWALERLLNGKVGTESEIMHLDSRWVRNHASRVTHLVTVALHSAVTQKSKLQLWSSLQTSLKIASAKEVQISTVTMEATASLCNVFRAVWRAPMRPLGSPSRQSPEQALSKTAMVTELILSSFKQFGLSTFVEKQLLFSEDLHVTYTHAPNKVSSDNVLTGPGLKFLFLLFQSPSENVDLDDEYFASLRSIIRSAISTQKSMGKVQLLLNGCLDCIRLEKTKLSNNAWRILIEVAAERIALQSGSAATQSPGTAGSGIAEDCWCLAGNLLLFGARIQQGNAYKEWQRLSDCLLGLEQSQWALPPSALTIPNALAKALLDNDCIRQEYVSAILGLVMRAQAGSKPSPKALGQGQPGDTAFEQIIPLISRSLLKIHTSWRKYQFSEEVLQYIGTITKFLEAISNSVMPEVVAELFDPVIALMARSEEGTVSLARATIMLIQRCVRHDTTTLAMAAKFIAACLESKDYQIVDQAISSWNVSFGSQSRIEYPSSLVDTIEKKGFSIGQLKLPTWPKQDPEVIQLSHDSKNHFSSQIPPPKMNKLSKVNQPENLSLRRASRLRSLPVPAGKESGNEEGLQITTVSEAILRSADRGKKRKRAARKSSSVFDEGTEPICSRTQTPSSAASAQVPSTTRRKRQKRSKTSEQGSPSRIVTDADQSTMDHVFASDQQKTFTLKKRDSRGPSPQLHSDPISESSPSVYSRIHRKSSQEGMTIETLRQFTRSLTPQNEGEIFVLEDKPDPNSIPEPMSENETASPLRPKQEIDISSDELMRIQMENKGGIGFDIGEVIDEELFLQQLRQYRSSLNQGRAISPGRRHNLATLMVEITKLNSEVADAYFSKSL